MEEDYSKAYLERTKNGEESMLLLRIGSDIDATMIQSILFSESISSLCLNQNIARNFVNTFSPIKIELYILKTDYLSAKEIIEDYAINYKGSLRLYDTNGNEIPLSISEKKESDSTDNQTSLSQTTETTETTNNINLGNQNCETKESPKNDISKGNFFSFEGICTLRKFWFHFLISFLIVLIDYAYSSLLYKYTSYGLDLAETIICCIILSIWNIHILCLSVQRFRSIGKNPWKLLIPIYGSIAVKFIPALKDQSNNKYLNYKIPGEKWLRVLLIILAVAGSGTSNTSDSIKDSIAELQKNDSEKIIFNDDDVICKKFNDEDGIIYYFNTFRHNDTVVDTIVFYDPDTLKYLKKKYKNFKKEDKDDFLDNFCDFIYEIADDYPYVELNDSNGDSIIYFEPEEYKSLTSDVITSYNPAQLRLWYLDFDECVKDLK